MKRYLILVSGAMILVLFLALAHATIGHSSHSPTTKCGLAGYVYNSQGNPAGLQLSKIFVRYSTGITDSTAYSYQSGSSYYVINCTSGLQSGTFKVYARTYENGSYKYSNWSSSYTWQPHWDLGYHNFNCTLNRPPPPDD